MPRCHTVLAEHEYIGTSLGVLGMISKNVACYMKKRDPLEFSSILSFSMGAKFQERTLITT